MKKYLYAFAVLTLGMAAFTSCSDDEAREFPVITVAGDSEDAVISVVQGGEVSIAPTYSNVADATYLWTDEEGNTLGTEPTLTYTPKKAGRQTVTLTVTTASGTVHKTFAIEVEEDLRTLTFEGDEWTALVDDPQYMGPMLYGDGTYGWTDENTQVSGGLTNDYGDGMFWGGGIAISNYVDADIVNHATYAYQLAVPASNGSSNFAVGFCRAVLSFADGKAREIRSMDITSTTYLLGVMTNGDGYAASLAEEGELTLVATGMDGDGNATATLEVSLAKDGVLLSDWQTVDFSPLGKVAAVQFTMTGSDLSSFGVKQPQYFAFDNVVVNYYAE